MVTRLLLRQCLHSRLFSKLQTIPRQFGTQAFSTTTANAQLRMGHEEEASTAAQGAMLVHEADNYEGVIVEPSSLPTDGSTFHSGLSTSVEACLAKSLRHALRDY